MCFYESFVPVFKEKDFASDSNVIMVSKEIHVKDVRIKKVRINKSDLPDNALTF